ncbi:ABC transporter ATP-binding protein [Auraticoccus monumenti]|uniref:ABC-2 type transport system ATP-binding protein n=1 Tax=Auraticoccus monumenti TaxID=675864 RepID=A0A1G7B537_9ACTN|nr:ABC transporter ATP-binding protein [Auraticoccus monumenti]SDE22234.1 ABC-2 type transport system ATP-binding protein [Auraticoccus monumenti]
MAAAPTIDVSGLRKHFGRHHALDGLDLRVHPGEVHGFLGPNGAGKSTTLRILLGLIRASGGRASVLGRDPWRDAVAVHRDLAYVPGDVGLWPNLSGGETIDLMTRLRGGADARLRRELVADFELDTSKLARQYSKGNRQKVVLVAAFARPARLYLLDEPTSGLDPVMEAVFASHVERVRAEGSAVLLSSHILSEVERLCDRVTIIRAGRTVQTGTLADLRLLTATTFRVTPGTGGSAPADTAALRALAGVSALRDGDGTLEFDVEPDALPEVLAEVARLRPSSVLASPPSLEQLFLRHYGSDPAEEVR